MVGTVELLLGWLASPLKSRRRLKAEYLILRHQINILRRQSPRRTRLSNPDRLVFVWLYRLCLTVVDAFAIIRPETLTKHGFPRIRARLPRFTKELPSYSKNPPYQVFYQ